MKLHSGASRPTEPDGVGESSPQNAFISFKVYIELTSELRLLEKNSGEPVVFYTIMASVCCLCVC